MAEPLMHGLVGSTWLITPGTKWKLDEYLTLKFTSLCCLCLCQRKTNISCVWVLG